MFFFVLCSIGFTRSYAWLMKAEKSSWSDCALRDRTAVPSVVIKSGCGRLRDDAFDPYSIQFPPCSDYGWERRDVGRPEDLSAASDREA